MFKKTVTYENFAGVKVTKDFYFHLSKGELLEMGVSDMEGRILRIVDAKDGLAILREFKAFIKMSVGLRSEDGERFLKDPESQSVLLDSPAYDELLMELCTNENASVEFINNLIPEKMRKEMQAQLAQHVGVPTKLPEELEDNRPAWERERRNPTKLELQTMTPEQLREAFAKKLGDKVDE